MLIPTGPEKLTNGGASTLYYKTASDVDSGDTALTSGANVTITDGEWFVSALSSQVLVEDLGISAYEASDTINGTLSVGGVTTLTGGIGPTTTKAAALGPSVYTAALDTSATLSAYGTDAAAADDKTVYLCSLFVPVNCTVTGIATLNGTNITTDKICNYLFNASGTALGQSAAAGTAPTPADTFQATDLTSPVAITGPAVYFIGRQHNGTTIGFQSIPTAKGYRPLAGSVAGSSFGAETSVTPPTTFTAGKGPFGFLY